MIFGSVHYEAGFSDFLCNLSVWSPSGTPVGEVSVFPRAIVPITSPFQGAGVKEVQTGRGLHSPSPRVPEDSQGRVTINVGV